MSITKSIQKPLLLIVIFWVIWLVSCYSGIDFNRYVGLYPRTAFGMLGIVFSPFLHGSFFHLLQNSVPFVILGGMILFFYPKIAYRIFWIVYLGTGVGVWLLARNSYHLGASGLVYGFAGYLFFSGVFRRNIQAMALSGVVAILYGGSMVEGIFPVEAHISWESHLIGAMTGAFSAWHFRHHGMPTFEESDPNPQIMQEHQTGFRNIENQHVKYFYTENEDSHGTSD